MRFTDPAFRLSVADFKLPPIYVRVIVSLLRVNTSIVEVRPWRLRISGRRNRSRVTSHFVTPPTNRDVTTRLDAEAREQHSEYGWPWQRPYSG